MARTESKQGEFVTGLGEAAKFVTAILKEVRFLGGSDEDLYDALVRPDLHRRIAELIVVQDKNIFPSLALAGELVPSGWLIVEDVAPTRFQVNKDLEFVSLLEAGEKNIVGEAMCRRAVSLKANLGLADAKYAMKHAEEIPAKLQGNLVLMFTGTKLCDRDGNIAVPYLCGKDNCWHPGFFLHFFFINRECDEPARLARCKQEY